MYFESLDPVVVDGVQNYRALFSLCVHYFMKACGICFVYEQLRLIARLIFN